MGARLWMGASEFAISLVLGVPLVQRSAHKMICCVMLLAKQFSEFETEILVVRQLDD